MIDVEGIVPQRRPRPDAAHCLATVGKTMRHGPSECRIVRRQAHNLKVAGSNPAPATKLFKDLDAVTASCPATKVANG